jgi:hypothetical protein
LTTEERAWLDQLIGSPGFEVTCLIQRWWRETRLRWTVRLTLAALGPDRSTEMIGSYLDSVRCSSLFFMPEALGFLDFVIRQGLDIAHLDTIARFERAMIKAAQAVPAQSSRIPDTGELRRARSITPHPAAAIVEFAAPPERVIGALLSGHAMPAPDGLAYPVIVAAGLPDLWRPATRDEARLFACCQPSAAADRLLTVMPRAERPLHDLLGVGALCLAT